MNSLPAFGPDVSLCSAVADRFQIPTVIIVIVPSVVAWLPPLHFFLCLGLLSGDNIVPDFYWCGADEIFFQRM